MNKFTSIVRRCIEDYSMIQDGDRIAVGVSGGKDSIALLCALANLQKFYPKKFELHAITVSLGFEEMDYSPIVKLCDDLNIPHTIVTTDIADVVFKERNESNPCSLCANMRRGVLASTMNELGFSKIALGHHHDDAIETFLMSLLYEGRISCFQPVTYLDRTNVTQIRPLLYVDENTIIKLVNKYNLPIVKNPCPMDTGSKRAEVKTLLASLCSQYPDLKSKIFGSMQRLPLKGWEPISKGKPPKSEI